MEWLSNCISLSLSSSVAIWNYNRQNQSLQTEQLNRIHIRLRGRQNTEGIILLFRDSLPCSFFISIIKTSLLSSSSWNSSFLLLFRQHRGSSLAESKLALNSHFMQTSLFKIRQRMIYIFSCSGKGECKSGSTLRKKTTKSGRTRRDWRPNITTHITLLYLFVVPYEFSNFTDLRTCLPSCSCSCLIPPSSSSVTCIS